MREAKFMSKKDEALCLAIHNILNEELYTEYSNGCCSSPTICGEALAAQRLLKLFKQKYAKAD